MRTRMLDVNSKEFMSAISAAKVSNVQHTAVIFEDRFACHELYELLSDIDDKPAYTTTIGKLNKLLRSNFRVNSMLIKSLFTEYVLDKYGNNPTKKQLADAVASFRRIIKLTDSRVKFQKSMF